MKIIILDTNVLIDNIYGFAPWVNQLLGRDNSKLVIPTIVIAEYLNDQQVETELGKKKSEEYLNWFIKQDLNEEIAKVLGTILRRKTYPKGAGLADLIVASTAIYLSGELATRNKNNFSGIPDLRFFNPKNSTP